MVGPDGFFDALLAEIDEEIDATEVDGLSFRNVDRDAASEIKVLCRALLYRATNSLARDTRQWARRSDDAKRIPDRLRDIADELAEQRSDKQADADVPRKCPTCGQIRGGS